MSLRSVFHADVKYIVYIVKECVTQICFDINKDKLYKITDYVYIYIHT